MYEEIYLLYNLISVMFKVFLFLIIEMKLLSGKASRKNPFSENELKSHIFT